MASSILQVPGIGNSGPDHWQTFWENSDNRFQRIVQREWYDPVCNEWIDAIHAEIIKYERPFLVAHSLGCLAVAHWAHRYGHQLGGALLVAVPDPEGTAFPAQASGFSPVPIGLFSFPSIVVASTNAPLDH